MMRCDSRNVVSKNVHLSQVSSVFEGTKASVTITVKYAGGRSNRNVFCVLLVLSLAVAEEKATDNLVFANFVFAVFRL